MRGAAAKELTIRKGLPARKGRWGGRRLALPAILVFGVLAPGWLGAQLPTPMPVGAGRVAPPAEIAGLDVQPAAPLEFSRAWLAKAEQVRRRREELRAAGKLDGVEPAKLAQEGAALTGVLRVPVIPVRYADVEAPFPETVLAERLFGAPRGDTLSYAAYWSEVSGGLLRVEGAVTPWVKLEREASYYLPKNQYGWARFGRVAELRAEALAQVDRWLDFSQFDNDGPDGVPNSGDDDGYVDFVAFVYATKCPNDWHTGGIWPHRAAMRPFETNDLSPSGKPILIADYVILPATEKGTCEPLHIGVLAHETGHAFGLPDLYDYDSSSQGIGAWGLMGVGSYSATFSPAHPSAWEKEQLGWVTVRWLRQGEVGLRIPPVERERVIFRYDLPGTGEYLLLENRQKVGSDAYLPGSGLLVWRVNPERAELGAWNTDEGRAAVRLIEADGRRDLEQGRNADPGDPFPGAFGRDRFELESPRAFRLASIVEEEGGVIRVDAEVGFAAPTLVVAPDTVWLPASAEGETVARPVVIRHEGGVVSDWTARSSVSWLQTERLGDLLLLRANPAGLEPGTHAGTVELVANGAEGVVGRVAVKLNVAAPGVPAVIARDVPWSWGLAARSGRIFQASYSWDPLGLRPRPQLLQLWDGERYPTVLVRLPADALFAPVTVARGDTYVLARARDENYLYRVTADGRARVVASRLGAAPAYGAAALPDGTVLVADWTGRIQRVTPQGAVQPWAELGAHLYQIAADSAGTVYAASYTGEVIRIRPNGERTFLSTGFKAGQLVALAATPGGDVFAGEKGGEGRIIRISADGRRSVVTRIPGAQFYGLAVDGRFLYALDLGQRQLLRIPIDGTDHQMVTAE
ncbi:MAG TPA: M6 family metalloprotease domain-containing protein [Longimicrobiales bacterium]